jgi:hypothetical protein
MKKKAENQGIKSEEEFEKYFEGVFSSKPEHIAPLVVYLCTEEAARINGRNFLISGTLLGLYSEPQIVQAMHKESGLWTLDELIAEIPQKLTKDVVNPAPAS